MKKYLLFIFTVFIGQICYSQNCRTEKKDINEIKTVIDRCLKSISGEKGKKRNWEEFRSLFLPTAQLSVVECYKDTSMVRVVPLERFIEIYRPTYDAHTFYESNKKMDIQKFGNIAQVFQIYKSEMDTRKAAVFGINCFQLVYQKGNWLIANLLWQSENKKHKIPMKYK